MGPWWHTSMRPQWLEPGSWPIQTTGFAWTWSPGKKVRVSRALSLQSVDVSRYCAIQWAQSSDSTSFTVTGNTALIEVVNGLPNDPLYGADCTTDFVVIPNPYFSNGVSVNTDRFCGNEFDTVYSKCSVSGDMSAKFAVIFSQFQALRFDNCDRRRWIGLGRCGQSGVFAHLYPAGLQRQ